jgi:hypothetical protein
MHIDWLALGKVALVTVIVAVIVVTIVSFAARFLDAAKVRTENGQSATALKIGSYALFAVVGLIILFGIWLMIPYFH